MLLSLIISMLLTFAPAAPTTAAEDPSAAAPPADLSRAAREVLDEMNLVRRDPRAYAEKYIRPRRKFYKGKDYVLSAHLRLATDEGADALDDCVEALAKAKAAPALAWSDGLARAAMDHVRDQGRSGETGHKGSDGSMPGDRVKRYGAWRGTIGENIGYGNSAPREIVIQLLIDDGVEGRGHRANILDPRFRKAGVAIGPHKEFRFICVMDLAGGFEEKTDRGERK